MPEPTDVDVIETNVVFAVDIKIPVKIRKATFYGNPNPEYNLTQVGRILVPTSSNTCDKDTAKQIVKTIQQEAFAAIRKYEGQNK